MEEKSTSHRKKWLNWAVPLLLILLLIIGGRYALKSDWLFDIVRDAAVEQINNQINGTVSIESVRGDLLRGFTAANVNLKDEANQDIANIDSLSLQYRFLSLVRSPHTIDELRIAGLDTHIKQDADSVWNVMKLVDLDEQEDPGAEVFWALDKLTIDRTNINIQSEYLLPDGFLNINELYTDVAVGNDQHGLYGTISELEFLVLEQRLPEPIEVFMAGSSIEERVTLGALVINSGRTLMEASAGYLPEGRTEQRLEGFATLQPLSWQDLALYIDDLPLQQDLQIKLGVEGSFENLTLSILADAPGLESFDFSVGFSMNESIRINTFSLSTGQINSTQLTGMGDLPALESFSASGSGELIVDQLGNSSWSGDVAVSGFRFDEYQIDSFSTDYNIEDGNARISAIAAHESQRADLSVNVTAFMGDLPEWNADLRSDNLNLATWLNNPELESNLNISANLAGEGFDMENFSSRVNLDIRGESFGDQPVPNVAFRGTVDQHRMEGFATAQLQQNSIETTFDVNDWQEYPRWNAEIFSDNLNAAIWLNNPDMQSNLNINATLEGEGFDIENFSSRVNLDIQGKSFGDQHFSELKFNGSVNQNRLEGFASGRLQESSLETNIEIYDWQQIPRYSFDVLLKEFNANELAAVEDFPTYLNGSFAGQGSSFELETLELSATVKLDSSTMNREEIQAFKTELQIKNNVLLIEDALLESPIADASFSARQHLIEFTDPDNKFDFQVALKDLMPMAPLAGLETLQSEGTIRGSMERNEEGVLEFSGIADLENTLADTLFNSPKISASVRSFITDEPEVYATLNIEDPTIFEFSLQDVNLQSFVVFKENEIAGDVEYTITDGDENALTQTSDFSVDSTRTLLRTNKLEFKTQLRTLALVEPFDLTYADDVLRVDTLTIATGNEDSYLELWAPHVDSLRQHVGISARQLDLGALQSIFMEDPIVSGYLYGDVELINSPDELTASATGRFEQFAYESGTIDSLRFSANLKDEWLDSEVKLWNNERLMAETSLRVPFEPGDPATFEDQFFDREIDGYFRLYDSDINYWLSFTPDGGFEDTEGSISLEGNLGGVAGNPELSALLQVGDGMFSGITVDSIGIDLQYLHEQQNVELNGAITKDNQPMLSFNAELPFLIDLRETEILLPSDDDEVYANIRTDDFNIAMFNNYVDRDLVRDIRGTLQGEVTMRGIIADLETTGQMQLTRGRMNVVPAGITLEEIASRVVFQDDRMDLQQFSMRSGPGTLRANGFLELDNLTPGNIEINVIGNQFRAFNTPVYNALINTNATFSGTFEQPRLMGSLTFLRGHVNLQNFGERAVEDVVLEDEAEPEPFEFYDALTLDMNVIFARQFFIRNRQYLDMEIELSGNVDLQKSEREDLQMFGQLEGVRGFVRPLGKNFILDEAIVTFYGPIDDPELNITTRFDPPQAQAGVRIFYIIEGTVLNPTFRFESEPELELQDIVSYTLFGRPFYELDGWEQVVAGSGSSPTAADIALDVLLDRVEMLATQRLGIDVVQIDNTRSGSGSNTSIKTGWYLNQRTFFAVINEIGSARPKTLFMLEYLLRENLELLITQGDDPRQGIDLRWRKDY